MRSLLLAAAAVLALAGPACAKVHQVSITDGDTVTIPANGTSTGFRLRLTGFDTPELSSECPAERALARAAKARLAALAAHGLAITSSLETDRYGRILATASTPNGEDVGQILIRERLARPYDGKTARRPWCDADGKVVP